MEITNNQTPLNKDLLNESLLIVGDAGTGKTVLIKNLIMHYYVTSNKRFGLIYKNSDELYEYKCLKNELQDRFSVFSIEENESEDSNLQSFLDKVDVVIIDEGDLTLESFENLQELLELCRNKINIVSYHTLDFTSKTLAMSIMAHFKKTVFFKTRINSSAEFLLDNRFAIELEQFTRGNAIVAPTNVRKEEEL